jgi:hypothetical protein
VRIEALADQRWVEDNDGSAALLQRHAARAGAEIRIDLTAAGLTRPRRPGPGQAA